MDPIRVVGRIDLAQQIHAALLAAGADARLATAAPMAVVSQTGRDGTGLDVIANGFEICTAIKKAAPGRPVVMVTFDEPGGAAPTAEAYAARIARTSRGPDGHLPWPASGGEILVACERAREAARVSRPRFSMRNVLLNAVGVAAVVVGVLFFLALDRARRVGAPSVPTIVLASILQAALFGAIAWWDGRRARTSEWQRRHRRTAVFCTVMAGIALVHGALLLLRALHR